MNKIIIANKDYIPIANIVSSDYSFKLREGFYFYEDTFLTTLNNKSSNLKESFGVFYTQQLKRDRIKLLAITCIKNTPEIIEYYKNLGEAPQFEKQFIELHSHFFINKNLLETPKLKGSRVFKTLINNNLTTFNKKKKEYVHYLEEWELFNMFIIDSGKLLDKYAFKENKIQLKKEFIQYLGTKVIKEEAPETEEVKEVL